MTQVHRARWMVGPLAVLLALALMAGCESNGGAGVADRPMATVDPGPRQAADQDEQENVAAAIVQMTNAPSFQPATVTVEAGESVQWLNPSERVHTVTANASLARDPAHVELPEGAERFHSGRIQPGGAYEHRFKIPGQYRYFCMPHEERGMLGAVIVVPSNGDPEIVKAE